jgi:DNA-binding MarR family transcriptional regulator
MTITKVERAPKRKKDRRPAAEKREPLRRRILESLAKDPASPSLLAEHVGSTAQPTVRILRKLLEEGLVEVSTDASDRRLKIYELTAEGEVHLNDQRALGTGGPPRPER